MALDGRRARAEELLGRIRAALDPHLVGDLAPAREHADAVAGAGDRVEVLEQLVPGQPLEHALGDLVGRLGVEHDPRHRAERAQPDDHAVEVLVAARGAYELALGGHELERGHGGGEVAVGVPGAVRRGGHRARHGDVRQRGQVVQRERLGLERLGQLAVAQAGGERDAARRSTTTSAGSASRLTSSSESAMSVNEWREPSTRTRGARATISRSSLDARGPVQPAGAVGVRAGPVGADHSARSSSRPAARTSASSPGLPTSCTDAGSPSSAGAARHGQRGRADRVERERQLDHALAQRQVADADRRRDHRQRRRDHEVEILHQLGHPLAVALALGDRGGHPVGIQAVARARASPPRSRRRARGARARAPGGRGRPRGRTPVPRRRAAAAATGRCARQLGRRLHALADQRIGPLGPGDAHAQLATASRASPARSRARARASIRSHSATSRAIGPTWSKLGASGKQPSIGTSPYVGLKPTIPQQAAGMRTEPPESVPSAASTCPSTSAAALPPLEPPGTRPGAIGIGHVAVVRVLRRDPPGELVQVGLADRDVAGLHEARHGRRGLRRHVVAEDRRAVRRPHAGGVEEVLDREPRALRRPARAR